MKKINLTLLVLFIGFSGIAQYKKASYFGRDGRIYGLGTRFHALGGYSGTVMGYTLSVARDRDGKQWFGGYEFEYIPGYKAQLEAWNNNTGSFTSGNFKTKAQLIYTYNFGYFLLKNDDAERKIKPYLSAALGVKLMGGVKDVEDDKDMASDLPFSVSLNGGAGLIYYIQPWLGLKAEGGYSYQHSLDAGTNYALPKHPYASAGLVFRIVSK